MPAVLLPRLINADAELACHPFETPGFLSPWWELLAPQLNVIDRYGPLALTHKPVLKSLLKLKVIRIAGWNNHYYQSFTEAHLEAFLHLNRSTNWDYFEIYINKAYTHPAVFNMLRQSGFPVIEMPAMPTPVLNIAKGWDAYWRAKGAKYCRDITKKLAAAKHLEPHLIFFKGEAGIERFFEQFFPCHLKYWESKTGSSYFQNPAEREFILRWAYQLEASGKLQLVGMCLGDDIANMSMNIVHDDTLYCHLTINPGDFAEFYPGLLSMHLMTQDACQKGFKKIDIGPGETHYKKKLATHLEEGRQVLILNPSSLAGKLYGYWRRKSLNH